MEIMSEITAMKPNFIKQKNRIFRLKVKAQETASKKMSFIDFASILGLEKSEMMIECENYYLALDKFLQSKIKFWDGCIAGEMPSNMLSEIQENMTEWLEAAWAYMGQKNIKKESERAKEEFAFMKMMCEILTKPKKTTSQKIENFSAQHL
jgi:hypothetical protein